ncbi:uncharacterized protein LOC121244416 isoform X2 [Juglans microcarpa x Juglans regia]|uniref:uncharacterized protein LOC121244416 isoform X2 n=1 Tax=Juglans microcarpa x Juglans regia TaxID=2249226 RepID=UPI001B7F7762|nr:uncharacterized protein LOC121244416 isoform X2 [Juglans microcarpa x Juglans regia]
MLPFLLLVFVIGFGVGALAIVVAEAAGLYFILNWLNWKTKQTEALIASRSQEYFRDLDPNQSLNFTNNKKGVVWILESKNIPRNWPDKGLREQKRKKDLLEVYPVKKHAKIKDQKLVLTESDGSHSAIELKGCMIEAVSATSLASRKWAKRFPIKIESNTSVIYNGNKTCYIYLETSWEKEAWCKSLRLASGHNKERVVLFASLHEEFHRYLMTLNAGYPSFMKPSIGFSAEPAERTNRPDGTSSKVSLLLKKIVKKSSRVGLENRSSGTSSSGRAERKANEKIVPSQETISAAGLGKRSKSEENMVQPLASTCSRSGSPSHASIMSDADSDYKFGTDEGTLCWNLLISRLFFDVKSNTEMKRSIQSRIQRTLSSMRTPSYIGELICTDIEPGNLPPYIHGMRILPVDMNEVWAFEVDIEYSGGIVIDIETRLEVRELDSQKGVVDLDMESSSVGEIPSDLLEGFEYFGRQFNPTGVAADPLDNRLKNCKSSTSASTYGSRWKSILNSIAKQVSQVPLSLAIRVTSLRGMLRFHIKPPPSDQLWFAFTSMPVIDFNLESSVGEHRITSGHIALFLVNRLKAAIQENLVLPNCESVCIPWMIADKDDWVSKNIAPFIRLHQEVINDPTTGLEVTTSQPTEGKLKTEASKGTSSDPECKNTKLKNAESINESSDGLEISTRACSSRSLQELRTPLLGNDEPQETCKQIEEVPKHQSYSRSVTSIDKQDNTTEGDDLRQKRMGRRARMLDLGKKVGEKLEEKRRHIEEKGRHIVEKMRGP